jgi:hypothetical protein
MNSLSTGTKGLFICAAIATAGILFYLWIDRSPEEPEDSVAKPAPAKQRGSQPSTLSGRKADVPVDLSGTLGAPSPMPGAEKPAALGTPATAQTASTSGADALDKAQQTRTRQAPADASASVTISGKELKLGAPNILGVYPRQNINPGASVPVRVGYPDAQTGDTVIAAVADGGQINGNKPVQVLTLDTDRAAKFTFQGSREPGLFRVTLRKGLDVKTLEFWSGPQPTYVKAKRPPLPIPK